VDRHTAVRLAARGVMGFQEAEAMWTRAYEQGRVHCTNLIFAWLVTFRPPPDAIADPPTAGLYALVSKRSGRLLLRSRL
jgi:hypothetical protein